MEVKNVEDKEIAMNILIKLIEHDVEGNNKVDVACESFRKILKAVQGDKPEETPALDESEWPPVITG